jgi:hypothetical protein
VGKSVTTFQVYVYDSNEKTDVELNAKKLKHIFMSYRSEAGQNHSFERYGTGSLKVSHN